ncbi:hypothetical protein ONE63_002073 [Megalurothrips usitatus]|uniref:Secreted protein n=1 Tax=Megalurothrips usitatus TaxID=439358 RepID=A0AAV7XBC7_9NEOP|nr:hypothetical protein ONE63_002073 [Megalurothrips usitatus]
MMEHLMPSACWGFVGGATSVVANGTPNRSCSASPHAVRIRFGFFKYSAGHPPAAVSRKPSSFEFMPCVAQQFNGSASGLSPCVAQRVVYTATDLTRHWESFRTLELFQFSPFLKSCKEKQLRFALHLHSFL